MASASPVKPRSRVLRGVLLLLFLALLASTVMAQANPLLTIPNPDGGYNLYAGSQILKGRLPYVDFWNTKGPGIYYLNALGVYLGHGLRWGVWFIEYLFWLGALVVLFDLARRQWNAAAAAFGVIVATAALAAVFNSGNLTEEYALLPNSVALYLFWSGSRQQAEAGQDSRRDSWRYLLIGCMAGISFSFRANNIGAPAAVGLAILVHAALQRRYASAFRKILLMAAGFVVPVGAGLLYFWMRGALPNYVEAVYLYNFRYSVSRTHSLGILLAGFGPEKVGWPSWIALAGALLALVMAIRTLARRALPPAFDIMLASVLWIEIALSSVSWRMFTHYFISWTPAIALLSAFLFAQAAGWLRQKQVSGFLQGRQPVALYGGLIAGLVLVARVDMIHYAQTLLQITLHRADGIQYRDYMSNYVIRHTQPDDTILTWPADAWINFNSRRDSPVRLAFYPVFDEGTITEQEGRGYLNDLQAHKPALILDCSDLQNDIPSLDPQTRAIQQATRDFLFNPPHIQDVFAYVASNYHVESKSTKCTIYRRN